ncbi:hypothetical protein [Mesorhizobium muleiense]|nr:hypothetical protein [Mesorhizobium muleiense]
MGASSESVTFLRLPGGAANHHVHAITHAVVSMLNTWRPQSVFVNYAKDPTSDHVAVNAAVRAALRAYGRPVTVFEYPVWIGTIASSTLNSLACLGDVIGVMREALAAHASQMQRLENQDEWRTLSDLSGGDFVGRLLAD